MNEITEFELVQQQVELLPAREALALVNLNGIVAANTAAAVNVLTVNSGAHAFALQVVDVQQS